MSPPGRSGKRYLLGDNSPLWSRTKELLKKQRVEAEAQDNLIKEGEKKLEKEQEGKAAVIPSLQLSPKKTVEEFVNEELLEEDGICFEESLMVNPLRTLRRCAAELDPDELEAAREKEVAKLEKEKSQVKKRRAPASCQQREP